MAYPPQSLSRIDPDVLWFAFDALKAEIAIVDRFGTIVATNTAWIGSSLSEDMKLLAGTSRGVNLLSLWRQDMYSDMVDPAFMASFASIADGDGDVASIEYENDDCEGKWYRVMISSLGRAKGGAVVSHLDVTLRRHAARALMESEARFRSLVQHGMEAISIADAQGVIQYEAPGIERVLGFKPEELVGHTMAGIHPDDLERVSAIRAEALREPGAHRQFSMRILNKAGAYRWLDMTATNMLHDPAVNGLVYNFRDISDQVEVEQALRFQTSILEQAWVSVAAVDNTGIITHWNRHSEVLCGWSAREAIGTHIDHMMTEYNVNEDLPDIRATLARGEGWQGEVIIQKRDLTKVHVRMNVSALRDEHDTRTGFVMTAVDISDRKRMEDQLRYLAVHDALTGLPSRTLLFDRLEQALVQAQRYGTKLAVLFIDLDRFKLVNDSFGHAAGDEVLKGVTARFLSVLPPYVTLARLSGDEFVVMLTEIDSHDAARNVAQALQDALRTPFELGEHQAVVGASIGIAFGIGDQVDADTLVRQADSALYRVKSTNRGAILLFDAAINTDATRFLTLKRDIRSALVRNQFSLLYQPIVHLGTGQISHVEALMRWNHPRFGIVPPSDFVSIAEDLGLLIAIGRWVVATAARHLAAYDASYPDDAPIDISINISARQFADSDLVDVMMRTLDSLNVDPHRVILELTEDALIQDMSTTIETLTRFRANGLRIMIDDFGSGYSSLGYLRQLPVDGIKLDRTFVRGLGTEAGSLAIVEAIIQMAHALDLRVTGEGIETSEQHAHLRAMGCDLGQGFLFGHPAPEIAMWRLSTSESPACPWSGIDPN